MAATDNFRSRAIEQAKAATAGMSEADVADLIDEAVQWAREH